MPTCPECGYVLEPNEAVCPRCATPAKGAPAQAEEEKGEEEVSPRKEPRKPPSRTELIGASAFAIIAIGVLVFMLTHTHFGPGRAPSTRGAASTRRPPTPRAPAAAPQAPAATEPAAGPMTAESSAAPMASAGALAPSAMPEAGGYEQPEAESAPAKEAEGEPAPAPEQPNAAQAGNEVTLPAWIVTPEGTVVGSSPETAPSSTGVAGESSQPQPGAARPQQPEDISRLLRYCPFDLRPGMEIRLRPGVQPAAISIQGARRATAAGESLASAVTCGGWTVRGIRAGALRLTAGQGAGGAAQPLWVDQPFEVLKDGRLVGSFGNTAEYWQALR